MTYEYQSRYQRSCVSVLASSDPYSLMKSLTELEPRYIVMYDTDMEFVRQIEVGFIMHLPPKGLLMNSCLMLFSRFLGKFL